MDSIKPIGHFLIVLGMINIVLQLVTHQEIIKEKPVPTVNIPALDQLIEDSRARDSITMQVILVGQHKEGLHEGESIDFCPMCQVVLKITEL